MSDQRPPRPAGDDVPDGDEKKGRPKDDRGKTEVVLEEGLPEAEKRKPRTGSDAED